MISRLRQSDSSPRASFLWAPLGVIRYELQRSLTPARLLGWALLVFFPILLTGLAQWRMHVEQPNLPASQGTVFFSAVLFILLPQVITILSLLLWATPAVNAELEGQTWVYAVVRPGGKAALLMGKYLVAVAWTATAGWAAAFVCVWLSQVEEPLRLLWTLVRLITLASFSYGALFLALGTLVQRRAMVVAFSYTLIVEVILASVPATINQLTVGFRLRSLGVQWQQLQRMFDSAEMSMLLELDGTTHHLWLLALHVLVSLSVALLRVRFGEYTSNADAT